MDMDLMDPPAPDLTEDMSVDNPATRALESPTVPESKRVRTIGKLLVNVSSLLVVVCAVYGAISGEALEPKLVEAGR